jgi:hypothetical protein
MSTEPCPNCVRLEAALETARDELTNLEEVAGARLRHAHAALLAIHDLASARITGDNTQVSPDIWAHDMREIERLSRP